MTPRDSSEPSTDRLLDDAPAPALDTPRTAPSADVPTANISVALSATPVSRDAEAERPTDPTRATPSDVDVTSVPRERRSRDLPARTSIDTLLSVPVPADRFEVHFEDRLDELTARLAVLEERTRQLELAPTPPEHEPRHVPSWIWIAFLLALALLAALVRAGR